MFQSLSWFRKATRSGSHARRRLARTSLTLEGLEDRLVPANLDYTALVQSLTGYPHSGPTHLYLNFDGSNSYGVSRFNGDSYDIQEILYRTSEIFAPFNVQVSRIFGFGNVDSSNNGDTTIFIGYNNQRLSFTPDANSDYPHGSLGSNHRPNSNANDVAYVDPRWVNGFQIDMNNTIAEAVAHEAGHTFGLVHVRTDGDFDPDALGAPLPDSPADIMGYTSRNEFFANEALAVTAFNGGRTPDANLQPVWSNDTIITQNSFTYLQTVLGSHPADGEFHVSDYSGGATLTAVDPSVQAMFVPQTANLHSGTPLAGTVSRLGDFNVFRLDTDADPNQMLNVDLVATGNKTLVPYLQIYNSVSGILRAADSTFNPATGADEVHVSLGAVPNYTYYFVVGSRDGNSQGTFNLSVRRLPVANNGSYTMPVNSYLAPTAAGGVMSFADDPDGRPMTVQLVTGPANGTGPDAGLDYFDSNGQFSYTPRLNFYGTDQFTYRVVDAYGQSSVATVQIVVNPLAPTAQGWTYHILSNHALSTNVLANNSDPQGLPLRAVLETGVPGVFPVRLSHGYLNSFGADGSFVYTPDAGYHGTDSFNYAVVDSLFPNPTVTATVTIVVGQPPVAMDLSYDAIPGHTLIVSVAEGLVASNQAPQATAHLVGPAPRGLVLNPDGSFVYRAPRHAPDGEITFDYYLTNPDGTSNIATVTIFVDSGPPV